jgi:hypothetical protein
MPAVREMPAYQSVGPTRHPACCTVQTIVMRFSNCLSISSSLPAPSPNPAASLTSHPQISFMIRYPSSPSVNSKSYIALMMYCVFSSSTSNKPGLGFGLRCPGHGTDFHKSHSRCVERSAVSFLVVCRLEERRLKLRDLTLMCQRITALWRLHLACASRWSIWYVALKNPSPLSSSEL